MLYGIWYEQYYPDIRCVVKSLPTKQRRFFITEIYSKNDWVWFLIHNWNHVFILILLNRLLILNMQTRNDYSWNLNRNISICQSDSLHFAPFVGVCNSNAGLVPTPFKHFSAADCRMLSFSHYFRFSCVGALFVVCE